MSEEISEINYTIHGEVKLENDGIQYIYNDEEFILDPLVETTDENEINDYYFPDGTRAILVDGQYYVPADTQAIVLQDGQENLNSYIIKQDCGDSIIVGEDQDASEQTESSEFIQYIESPASEGQQIIYYTSADDATAISLDEYDGTEASIEQQYQMQDLQDIPGDDVSYADVKPVPMQQVVDLEDLVQQENGENEVILKLLEDMPQDDARQCWYAVLKDGKLHIQTYTPETQPENLETSDLTATTSISREAEGVDLSQITGRNLITGQTVTLHEYMAKLQRKLSKASEETAAVASVISPTVSAEREHPSTSRLADEAAPRTMKPRTASVEKTSTVLKNLLHKTIPIGKTTNGKKIVGKIVKVQVKNNAEASVQQKIVSRLQSVQSAIQSFQNEEHSYVSQLQSFTDLVDNDEIETLVSEDVSTTEVDKPMEPIDDSSTFTLENDQNDLHIMKIVDDSSAIDEPQQMDMSLTEMVTLPQAADVPFQQIIPQNINLKSQVITLASNVGINRNIINPIPEPTEETLKPVKIIVKTHQISKECYEDICKTLCGLMEMATIQKKLAKRNLAVKVVEKKFNTKEGKMVKNALHIYGYMELDCITDSSGNILEKWNFVPDKNTQNALLADEVLEQEEQQSEGKTCKFIETVPITLLMTYDRTGRRSIKVVLNPCMGNRCAICTKEFKTYTQAQQHMVRSHNVDGSRTRCDLCRAQFEDAAALEAHKEGHVRQGQLMRCYFCEETFATGARLFRHVSKHVPLIRPLECSVCLQRCSSESALKKHLLLHTGIKLYECDTCHRKYSSQSDLSAHQRTHDPVKFFICLVCNRKFTRFSNLVRHNEIHKKTGNSLYTCEICGASYCFSSSLTRHMVQNHINANAKCS